MGSVFDLFNLSGKIAIITGGGRGIGFAIAEGFASAGAISVIADIQSNLGEAAVARIRSQGFHARFVWVDVTQRASVRDLVSKVLEEFHQIDILVNNAGVILRKPIAETNDEEWNFMMDVNLRRTFLCPQAVGLEMIKRRSGKIINLSSNVSHTLQPNRGVYAVTKAGISHLTRALALDWAPYHINVNAIAPGVTITELNRKYFEEHPGDYRDRLRTHPIGRLGNPHDYMGAALLLASKPSDFMTGQILFVDGGSVLI